MAGLPTSDETAVAGGRASTFTGAAIYWSPATGAHEAHGAIRARYLTYGGRQNTFQHGSITYNAPTATTAVHQL